MNENENEVEVQPSPIDNEMESNSRKRTKFDTENTNEKIEVPSEDSESIEEKRKSSIAWEHFKVIEGSNPPRAKCIHCPKTYACHGKNNGTTSMRNHIVTNKCTGYRYKPDKTQQPIDNFTIKSDKNVEKSSLKEIRRLINEMVIIDEHSFRMVEGLEFRRLVNYIVPNFIVPCRQTVKDGCMLIYRNEKNLLKAELEGKRICLTTDCWTSLQNLNYMCLTAHYVDNWSLKKKIINFKVVENHKGHTIGKYFEECLLGWGIQDFLTLTVDNASSNDTTIDFLKKNIKWKNEILGNRYMHVRCAGHILNLVVKEGLKEHAESILKIRNVVRYVRYSPLRKASFDNAKTFTKNTSNKCLVLDVDTRWNSTYEMLEVAQRYEDVFGRMARMDYEYKKYFKVVIDNLNVYDDCDDRNLDVCGMDEINIKSKSASDKRIGPPTQIDFENARNFVKFLKKFYEVTLEVCGSNYVTVNQLFLNVIGVNAAINSNISQVQDTVLSSMACRMKEKLVKYWGKMVNQNLLSYVAVVLDPRYKLKFISYCLRQVYEYACASEMTEKVKDVLNELFEHYGDENVNTNGETSCKDQVGNSKPYMGGNSLGSFGFLRDGYAEHLKFEQQAESTSESNKYMNEACESINYPLDILVWWKVNSEKYHVLSKIAKDILAIPVSTVASEAAFSTSGRVIDPFRSRLLPDIAEALICTQN